jgi:RNA polymerase sigma factor (TIGR02999 family)
LLSIINATVFRGNAHFYFSSAKLLTAAGGGNILLLAKIMEESARNSLQITQMLKKWSEGNQEILDKLMPLVYEELRRQASRYLRRERANHTLQTTALIHEAYLKLIDQNQVEWQNRTHFFAIAAQAMRRILVDYARERNREKRGGAAENLPLEEAAFVVSGEKSVDLVALDEALTRLAEFDERQARVVELRYFSGLSIDETADILGVSNVTVRRDWNMAKAWLHQQITK